MSNMDVYMNRILPMVGNELREKTIMFFNLNYTHRIAEGFARSGVKKFVFYDNPGYFSGTAMHASYGKMPDELFGTAQVMEHIIKRHNHYEQDWMIETVLPESETFSDCVKRIRPDIIIGSGFIAECSHLAKVSRELETPIVIFSNSLSGQVNSAISVLDPANDLTWSIFDDLITPLHNEPFDHVDWLETSALAGLLAKGLLLRKTKYQDKYLEKLFYTDKRNNVLRGTEEWPWWTFFGSEKSKSKMISLASKETAQKHHLKIIPKDQRLMVIGCGTGSLFVEEVLGYYQSICLVDCKPFSVFNPVRQWVTTREAESDMSKPFVLQDIIAKRFGGGQFTSNSLGRVLVAKDLSVWAINLEISNSAEDSKEAFETLLDEYRPTVVIVGMGRARNDNFTVSNILRERDIKHIIPGIFPLATHYKHIVVDGKNGPCYGCLQGRLIIDTEGSVELSEEQRQMYYGYGSNEEGTQPATIFDTWPATHALLRLTLELSLSPEDRSKWFNSCLQENRACWVGATSISMSEETDTLYGTSYPGQVVTYSENDIVGMSEVSKCPDCGRVVVLQKNHIFVDDDPASFFKSF